MATYLILNTLVLLAVALAVLLSRQKTDWRAAAWTFGVMLVLTLVFDNLIIMAGIVEYSADRISGLYIFKAPVEDFAYTAAAVLVVPLLWNITKGKE